MAKTPLNRPSAVPLLQMRRLRRRGMAAIQRTDREVFERWEVHPKLGKVKGPLPGRSRRPSLACDAKDCFFVADR